MTDAKSPRWEIKLVPGNRCVQIRVRRTDGSVVEYGFIDSKGWVTYGRPERLPESVRAAARRVASRVDNEDESLLFAKEPR